MASPDLLDLLQLTLVTISIPVYVWFLVTIIRNRKIEPFSSSFFTLALSLGVIDIAALINSWMWGKFCLYGWLWLDELVKAYNSVLAKWATLNVWYCLISQFIAVALIAYNRYTALALFDKHELIWSSKFLAGALALQWLGPMVVVGPLMYGQEFYFPIHNTTGELGWITWADTVSQGYYFGGSFIFMWFVILLTAGLYGSSLWSVRKMFKPVQAPVVNNSNNNNTKKKSELKLGLIGLVITVLLTFYGIVTYMMGAAADLYWWSFWVRAWTIISDVFSWSNPWLCLGMSKTVRKHMIALIRCNRGTANG